MVGSPRGHIVKHASSRIAWSIWGATLCGLVSILVMVLSRTDPQGEEIEAPIIVTFLIFVLGFATTGALVTARHPSNPVGWIAASVAALYVCAGFADSYVNTFPGVLGDAGVVARASFAIGESLWSVALGLGGTLLLLLFPDGRLPSRRWRPVAWVAGIALGTIPVALALTPGRVQDYPVDNPLGIPGAGPALDLIVGVALMAVLLTFVLSVSSLFVRYRGASAVQRQQLKWLLFAVGFVVVLIFASVMIEVIAGQSGAAGEISNLLSTAALSSIPLAIGVAILKHRLYDIDVLINRALVYGGLTGVLGLLYVTIVFGLQQALSPVTRESDLAIAASTLAVAALFRPARTRIQGFIDKRFYRRRFDAQKTLESFSARARNEVELGVLATQLVSVVRETMDPNYVSLWLRDPGNRE